MQITRMEPVKGRGRKFRIYLNDEPAFLLYASDIAEYKLAGGQELAPDTLAEIYSAVLLRRAKLRCMYILKTMDKTEGQLRRKLKEEEYPDPVIDGALDFIKSFNYVNDLRYSMNYMESRQTSKSRQQITAELRNRGVSPEVIEQAWENSGTAGDENAIRHWIEKKSSIRKHVPKKKRENLSLFYRGKAFFTGILRKH